jgi:hypothetical protein
MTRSDENSVGAGRPARSLPLQRWIDHVEAVRRVRPGPGLDNDALFARLSRDHPSAVHETKDSFLKVLNGKLGARPGFDTALALALRLDDHGFGPDDFAIEPLSFEEGLRTGYRPALDQRLADATDGTHIDLVEGPTRATRHFGSKSAIRVLDADVEYFLSISRPPSTSGVSGPTLLVGYGEPDRAWQLVSAVTEVPLSPTREVQWGRLTGVSLKPTAQPGIFILYVLGAMKPLPTALTALFERHSAGSGFLDEREITQVQRCVEEAVQDGAWSAALKYAVRS